MRQQARFAQYEHRINMRKLESQRQVLLKGIVHLKQGIVHFSTFTLQVSPSFQL
jgi:hypothetical protein